MSDDDDDGDDDDVWWCQGDGVSMLEVGEFYLTGRMGVARSPRRAFQWVKKAADRGDCRSENVKFVLSGVEVDCLWRR